MRDVDRTSGSWIAFILMAFVISGLAGVFATYALPIPMERALAREAALDDALVAARSADPAAALAALEPRLDDSAAMISAGAGTLEQRIQRERLAMRARFLADETATAIRLRWLTIVVTLTGALFVVALLGGMARRGGNPPRR